MQATVFPVRTHATAALHRIDSSALTLRKRFDLTSTSSLPIALQRRQIYFDLLHSQFSPTSLSSPLNRLNTNLTPSTNLHYHSRFGLYSYHVDEMDDGRKFHYPADKAKAGEAPMNIQPLEERLSDLKKQLWKASTTFSSAGASPVDPYEVRVSLITSDRSLNFPFRTHSQFIPHPVQLKAQSVSTTSLIIYGIVDASKNVNLIRYSIWGIT